MKEKKKDKYESQLENIRSESYIGTWTKTKDGYEWKYLPKYSRETKVKKRHRIKEKIIVYNKTCKMCNLRHANSKHHIRPKSMGGEKKVKICGKCHRDINHYFSNWELAKLYKEGIYPTTQTFNDMLKLRKQDDT